MGTWHKARGKFPQEEKLAIVVHNAVYFSNTLFDALLPSFRVWCDSTSMSSSQIAIHVCPSKLAENFGTLG